MPKFDDYQAPFEEVKHIVETFVEKFPSVFSGFRVNDVGFVLTKRKKPRGRHPIKVRSVSYPYFVFSGLTYIFEVLETKWEDLDRKRRNLAVFHAMCSVPVDGFDVDSKDYGKIVKPDFLLYRAEYAAAGGVADWFEDDRARDPMDAERDDVSVTNADDENPIPSSGSKSPVTEKEIMETAEEVLS